MILIINHKVRQRKSRPCSMWNLRLLFTYGLWDCNSPWRLQTTQLTAVTHLSLRMDSPIAYVTPVACTTISGICKSHLEIIMAYHNKLLSGALFRGAFSCTSLPQILSLTNQTWLRHFRAEVPINISHPNSQRKVLDELFNVSPVIMTGLDHGHQNSGENFCLRLISVLSCNS